ncbi:CTP synthase 2 isoform X6 [Rhineura floridana]|uniref:CTP synthase 2 isoform X6 n=1 Tax=Rhineura floridana TaxID=261503 RepID=UPI002AC80479|nr:CTP synthase 2 isoform X6 [Rhineura floridana]
MRMFPTGYLLCLKRCFRKAHHSRLGFQAQELRCTFNYPMKYILVTGGVISGIGKGIIASSIGTILKSCGLRVTAIKIDPYINIDAGTFSPYEHGEVFVLNDGGEVDLDLGNYERFLDINLYKDNNITTGKIYQHVINKERHGDYMGKTVQVVPHITDAVQEWVMNQSKIPVDGDKKEPQICVIELGGTIGDIEGMPFIEAFRQFQFKAKRENFCNIHVSLVPQPNATGEQKTKPTQNSVRALRGLGLSPDLIVCRSTKPIEMAVKEKISMFCHVEPEQYIDSTDLEYNTEIDNPVKFHQAWQKLCKADCILVPGGFGHRGTEGKLQAILWARKKKKPFLGVCLGMQLAVVEFARNCLNWQDANSTEFDPNTKNPVQESVKDVMSRNTSTPLTEVIDMPEHNPGDMGGTMRLGKRKTVFKTENSVLRKLYGDVVFVEERHRHRYEVNPELTHFFEDKGLRFVGHDTEGKRMEVIELNDHPYFIGVQFHPEFSSRPMKPSPAYLGLLLAATGSLSAYLQHGCKLSPSDSYGDLSDDSFPEKELPESETS